MRRHPLLAITFITCLLLLVAFIVPSPTMRELDRALAEGERRLDELEQSYVMIREQLRAEWEYRNEFLRDVLLAEHLQEYLYLRAKAYNVDYDEALAIMTVENRAFNVGAVSTNTNGTRDFGLFQINEINLPELREVFGQDFDLLNPYHNIEGGLYLLHKLRTTYKLTGHEKYMAYNMGVTGMRRAVRAGYTSTSYSRQVMSILKGE